MSLAELSAEGAYLDSGKDQFDPDRYDQMLQRGAPIIRWVEGLAFGLESRGAGNTAKIVRGYGFNVQTTLYDSTNPLEKYEAAQSLLQYLDAQLLDLYEDESDTGTSALVLSVVLQTLARDNLSQARVDVTSLV